MKEHFEHVLGLFYPEPKTMNEKKGVKVDIFDEMEKEETSPPVDLGLLSELVRQQEFIEAPVSRDLSPLVELAKEFSLAELEEVVKSRKQELYQLSTVSIPELMAQYGIERVTTSDGTEVMVKEDFSVNLSSANKTAFYNYLRELGYGDLIKDQVILTGCDYNEVVELLKDRADIQRKEDVHFQTLKKFIRGQMADGNDLPNCISVYPYKTTKLKRRKI